MSPPPASSSDLLTRAAVLLGAEASRWQRAVSASALTAPSGSAAAPAPPEAKLAKLAPLLSPEKIDELRRLGSTFLETLLTALVTGQQGPARTEPEAHVPLIRCLAAVHAGETARASLRITNEQSTPSEVMLYASNFVADSGYELPSTLVSAIPRVALVQPNFEASFEIEIAVPVQAARGCYSGLVQALGSPEGKAVITLEVV